MLAEALRQAHVYLESRLDLCGDPEVLYARLPGSRLQSIGSIYAHAVVTEDHSLGPKAAVPELGVGVARASRARLARPGLGGAVRSSTRTVAGYAAAVYASTEGMLVRLGDAELAARTRLHLPEYDGAKVVIKEREASVLFALVDNVVLHMSEHTGEISALLGVQGGKATPW